MNLDELEARMAAGKSVSLVTIVKEEVKYLRRQLAAARKEAAGLKVMLENCRKKLDVVSRTSKLAVERAVAETVRAEAAEAELERCETRLAEVERMAWAADRRWYAPRP